MFLHGAAIQVNGIENRVQTSNGFLHSTSSMVQCCAPLKGSGVASMDVTPPKTHGEAACVALLPDALDSHGPAVLSMVVHPAPAPPVICSGLYTHMWIARLHGYRHKCRCSSCYYLT